MSKKEKRTTPGMLRRKSYRRKDDVVVEGEDHNKLYRGIMNKVMDGSGSVSSPTKKQSLSVRKANLKKVFEKDKALRERAKKAGVLFDKEVLSSDKKDGSFLQRIETKKVVSTGVVDKEFIFEYVKFSDVRSIFLLCLKTLFDKPHMIGYKCVDCEVTIMSKPNDKVDGTPDCPDCGDNMKEVKLYDDIQIDKAFGDEK